MIAMPDALAAPPTNASRIAQWFIPCLFLIVLIVMVVPLPPIVLDLLLTFNIALSVLVLMVVLQTQRPLDLSVFPALLLMTTVLRLALNMASSRLVLLQGHHGGGAAGQVIESFGQFLMAGNYIVGVAVFIIIITVNYLVITKGAGRIAEVAARFTLDSLPGKYLAIDSELQAGHLSAEEARQKRDQVAQEGDFYGAMDGAARFIRGDAIAGIFIVVVNSVGGIVLGIFQHGMTLSQISKSYLLLTVGDGLATQIPALALSTSAALLISRTSSRGNLSGQIIAQLFSQTSVLIAAAVALAVLGLWPGMPHSIFFAVVGVLAWFAWKKKNNLPRAPIVEKEVAWADVRGVDKLCLEVGFGLIRSPSQSEELLKIVRRLRKQITEEFGFLCPAIQVRDNLSLKSNGYILSLCGAAIGEGELHIERKWQPWQEKENEDSSASATGQAVHLSGRWLRSQEMRQRADKEQLWDWQQVLAAHLLQLLRHHVSEILDREQTEQLLDNGVGISYRKELCQTLSLGTVQRVLQELLIEKIPLTNIALITDVLLEQGKKTHDVDALLAQVRVGIRRSIVNRLAEWQSALELIALPPEIEAELLRYPEAIEPDTTRDLLANLIARTKERIAKGKPALLVTRQALRVRLARLCRLPVPQLTVLAYEEIPEDRTLHFLPFTAL